jgi:DNA repair exonuclease SbcCD ATPase subunit
MLLSQSFRNQLERKKGQKLQLEKSVSTLTDEISELKRSLRRHEQAREIIREVGLATQQQLQFHISDITSLALEAVFNDPYELKVEFVQRRNKTECDLLFSRDGNDIEPKSASGGGAVDVAAFALRIASWSMQTPRSRNVIILDEPMRFLSVDLQERASLMIKEISKKIGVQFIIVTHSNVLTTFADKTFEVTLNKGISKVKTL